MLNCKYFIKLLLLSVFLNSCRTNETEEIVNPPPSITTFDSLGVGKPEFDSLKMKSFSSISLIEFSTKVRMISPKEKDSIYYTRNNDLFLRSKENRNDTTIIKLVGGLNHTTYNGNIKITNKCLYLFYWIKDTNKISRRISKYDFEYKILCNRIDSLPIKVIYLP
jgi:hypothetical protein